VYADEGEGLVGKLHCTAKQGSLANEEQQAKPTHQNIIRLAPPLVITEDEIKRALAIIGEAVVELPHLKGQKEKEVIPEGEKNVKITVDN
jgi:ornithine--oxo-acid transaminase